MARTEVLTIKVSLAEKNAIKEAARLNRRTYSDWSRLILDEAIRNLGLGAKQEAETPQAEEGEEASEEKVACGVL